MKKAYLEALDGHRAEIKRKWEILLRAAPATTPLGNPDTLIYLMDESLKQLFSLFHSKSTHQWLSLHPPAAHIIGTSVTAETMETRSDTTIVAAIPE